MKGGAVNATCSARTTAQTGVEMEALAGVAIALLTIYDMCKAIDKEMEISDVRLVRKDKASRMIGHPEQRRGIPMILAFKVSQRDSSTLLGMTRQEMQIVVGIITISDRASGGQYQDLGGPAVKAAAEKRGWNVLAEADRAG